MGMYHPSDTIPMTDFEFAWRITDPRWSSLPEQVLSRIKPLSSAKSKELLEKSRCRPVDQFQAVRRISLEGESNAATERVMKWLRELPMSPRQEVYLCWEAGDGVAAVTDWATFVKVWDDLWHPFDRLCAFDETENWAVVFGPEEEAVFVERAPSG